MKTTKPCPQRITPQLSLGGSIMENASNGNTKVKINNRVITKTELKMLKVSVLKKMVNVI